MSTGDARSKSVLLFCTKFQASHSVLVVEKAVVLLQIRFQRLGFQKNRDAIYAAEPVLEQFCETHQTRCAIPHVDFDMSGLPCTDNSRQKPGRLFEEGPTGPLFAIWAVRLRRYQIPLAILENTPEAWRAIGCALAHTWHALRVPCPPHETCKLRTCVCA